jgi:hypothetical protein
MRVPIKRPIILFISITVVMLLNEVPLPAQYVVGVKAGIIQYCDGAVFLDGTRLPDSSNIYYQMENGQELRTAQGRAELLLAPNTYLRMGENAALRMDQNRLNDIRISLEQGSALLEVVKKIKLNPIRINFSSGVIEIQRSGLYRLDSGSRELQVNSGKAFVEYGHRKVKVSAKKKICWNRDLAPDRFDVNLADSLHMWAAQRSFINFIATENTRQQSHWILIAPGWLLNTNFQMRFYSELFYDKWFTDKYRKSNAQEAIQNARQTQAGQPSQPVTLPPSK